MRDAEGRGEGGREVGVGNFEREAETISARGKSAGDAEEAPLTGDSSTRCFFCSSDESEERKVS